MREQPATTLNPISIPNETTHSTSRGTTPLTGVGVVNGNRKMSTPSYDDSTSNTSKEGVTSSRGNPEHRGRSRGKLADTPFSPSGSAFSPAATSTGNGNDTPLITSTSADPSIIAVHGSVMTNFPMPRGKHEGLTDWDKEMPQTWEKEKEVCKEKPVYKNDRLIAIDFDDVCSQNMATLIREHNAKFGTDLTVDDLQTYVFWQNRGWGTPAEVARKVQTLNNLLPLTSPIPGFADALRTLHGLGHPIHIVTSRPESDRQGMIDWLIQEGITIGDKPEDVIVQAHFTGTYGEVNRPIEDKGDDDDFENELNERLKALWRDGVGKGKGGLGKLKILRELSASLFIDDHHGNLEPIINASPPIPCLLFGEYGWNKSRSGLTSPVELMDYNQRMLAGLPLPFEEIQLGREQGVFRVRNWDETIEWVKEWDREAVEVVSCDT
ncbi:uncharacterized protein IL334_003303 [Kwoniella shivajii]|uniref:Swiss Army Knife RNA repair protein HAD domain-containing protein n=1 Tax=Kwoniella shivajii TaxID=564305 RepID=A0ABZ1CX76_9TREE|nr:hypothetical protein IL334_003303 [Kwoniella shivajii]